MRKGTAPPGAATEAQASQWVRGMFGRIAPRYDTLNHLLSMNVDRYWRGRTVRRVRDALNRPGATVLDLCCGTGDLTIALARASEGSAVLGSDFCHPMLVQAGRKLSAQRLARRIFESDALKLPVRDGSLDLITVAFGFRNLVDYRAGLREFQRVLKPGGTAAILEFSQPPNALFAAVYNFYSRRVLPVLGGWISGSRDAYTYLPESVSKFPGAEELAAEMRKMGFQDVEFTRMTGGVVALHIGKV
ncbi:MAG TPA: bifunctional demethylmenaquinone methyltransferase/2-methoxy-6-polyprenyl-1,4-benzoquinol methylase UbiE [Bryobacteraceae bacterium]|jgi:demethylmenaquinone methyltransferase/2-methoxy-6-polyprenyl-1,4-benzoquinol methylase|nr:bifunctional demethylmenaquinone methyltransferase/2-methoxy-6-polyprenyl-1,4-benzoquinol methylase UbiE [Bryobacteraceae bacterium]